jgi:hypothetical protein
MNQFKLNLKMFKIIGNWNDWNLLISILNFSKIYLILIFKYNKKTSLKNKIKDIILNDKYNLTYKFVISF